MIKGDDKSIVCLTNVYLQLLFRFEVFLASVAEERLRVHWGRERRGQILRSRIKDSGTPIRGCIYFLSSSFCVETGRKNFVFDLSQ